MIKAIAMKIEAIKIAPPAEPIQMIAVCRGRTGRTAFEKLIPQLGGIALFPNFLPVQSVEAENGVGAEDKACWG